MKNEFPILCHFLNVYFRIFLHPDGSHENPTRTRTVQRSAFCRSRRELSNAFFLAKFGFDTAENEPCRRDPSTLGSRNRGEELELWNMQNWKFCLESMDFRSPPSIKFWTFASGRPGERGSPGWCNGSPRLESHLVMKSALVLNHYEYEHTDKEWRKWTHVRT